MGELLERTFGASKLRHPGDAYMTEEPIWNNI